MKWINYILLEWKSLNNSITGGKVIILILMPITSQLHDINPMLIDDYLVTVSKRLRGLPKIDWGIVRVKVRNNNLFMNCIVSYSVIITSMAQTYSFPTTNLIISYEWCSCISLVLLDGQPIVLDSYKFSFSCRFSPSWPSPAHRLS